MNRGKLATIDVDGGLPSSHDKQQTNTPSSSAAAHVVWSDVALSVAQLDGVYVVEPRPLFRLLNKASRIIIGVDGLAAAPPFLASSLSSNAHLPASFVATATDGSKSVPIDGAGQVVSLLDSGLDTHHCLFKDSTEGTTYSNNHRKVVALRSICQGCAGDGTGGHGTHVGGSIAGACENPQAGGSVCESGGSAPGAKLAMTEAGQPGQRWLYTLAMDDVLGWGAAKGATIHSHSWGGDNTRYTTTSRGTDAYVNTELT